MSLSVKQAVHGPGLEPGTAGRVSGTASIGPLSFAREGMFAH